MAKTQSELAGFEASSIPEIDALAVAYYATVEKRLKIQKKEAEAKATLMQAFVDHGGDLPEDDDGVKHYRYTDGEQSYSVRYTKQASISVKKEKKPALEVVE